MVVDCLNAIHVRTWIGIGLEICLGSGCDLLRLTSRQPPRREAGDV